MTQIALTRKVSRSLERCELTHLQRRPVDVELARAQHASYEQALRDAGCDVQQLDELPDHPDSVFVEDTAVVLDEVAVLTCPGAVSRRGEVDSMAAALAPYRELCRIEAPATLDGGDVLRLGRVLYVGKSGRSNAAGVAALRKCVARFGYRVKAVPLNDCLHLKSAVTQVASDLLLVNPAWVDEANFAGFGSLAVDPAEAHAANAVWLGECILLSAAFPRTVGGLREAGIDVCALDMSETEKAEGALTCCSVIFEA